MTQNKFWLVLNEKREISKYKHATKSYAIIDANELASKNPQHTYFVMEAVLSFKANVDVIETDLIVDEVDSTATKPKFKVGDIVTAEDTDNTVFEVVDIFYSNKAIVYLLRNSHDHSGIRYAHENELSIMDLTADEVEPKATEPTLTELPTPKFKVGDFVDYNKCKYEVKRVLFPSDNDYPNSFIGGIAYEYKDNDTGGYGTIIETVLSPWEDESPTPKFKVGDFVEYNKCKYEIHEIALRDDDSYPCNFKGVGYKCKSSDTGAYSWIPEGVLSPWEDESPKHGFKVGDKVKYEVMKLNSFTEKETEYGVIVSKHEKLEKHEQEPHYSIERINRKIGEFFRYLPESEITLAE